MIAQISATASRTSRHPVGSDRREPGASSWAARLARIILAIYLLPVLLVMLLVGVVGVVILGVVGGGAKLAAPIRNALEARRNKFPL